jgi:hypothetical protein
MRCVHREGELLAEYAHRQKGRPVSTPVLFFEFDGIHIDLQSEKKAKKAKSRTTYKAEYLKKSIEMKVGVLYAGKIDHRRIGVFHWVSNASPADFFSEGIRLAKNTYDMDELEYLSVASDAAAWCKNHGLEVEVANGCVVISTLDVYHINKRVYKAFTKEEDRSLFLNFLYAKDYKGFFGALTERMDREPEERIEQRQDLYSYIENNLDWLSGPSLSRHMRERLVQEIPAVFSDRSFYDYLLNLLTLRRYKRFLKVLEHIVDTCTEELRYDYSCFLDDAKEAIRLIRFYGRMGLGTMEGTNAKVYAFRLKVWGCSWSKRGALAMMRIRAHLASGLDLIAPGYRSWLTDEEKLRRKKHDLTSSAEIAHFVGKGYEPPRGSFFATLNAPPSIYGYIRN